MDVWLSLFWMEYVCSLTQKCFSSWSTERAKFLTFIQRLRRVRVMCKHEISSAPALKWDFLRRDTSYVWQEKQNLNIWIFIDSIFSKRRTQDGKNQLNNWTFCQKTHRRQIIIQSREYVYISSNVQRASLKNSSTAFSSRLSVADTQDYPKTSPSTDFFLMRTISLLGST